MDKKVFTELDLEEIIREFSDHPQEPAEEPPVEEVPAEELPTEEIPEKAPEEKAPVEEADAPEEDADALLAGDTIRMAPITDLPRGEVRNAQPIDDSDEDTRVVPPVPEQKAEPFSEQWEPEYEQPIGEYKPPRAILIHPQSRLRELKRKLVAGPEKRYYALSEKGFGRLQTVIFLAVLVMLLSAGATVLYTLDMVQESRMRLMVFGQLLALFLSALLGSFQLIEGGADLLKGRFSMNTLLLFTFILCCVDGVLCLQELRVPCCAAFSLQVVFSLCDTHHRRRAELGQMDTLRRATSLTAVRPAEAQLDGHTILLRNEGQVEDVMDHYAARTVPEKVLSWYGLGALLSAIGIGVMAYLTAGLSMAVQTAAITLLAAVPASGFICQSRPMAILEKKLSKMGTVLCGWQGVRAAKGKIMFPLSHMDLFPSGAVKLNGVKYFGNRNPHEIISYATALIVADGNGLSPLFEQLRDNYSGRRYSVTALRSYDGGIGGEVQDEPVLIGNLSFLRTMGVEIPEGMRVNQAVCVSIDGELCGLFAITYEKDRAAAAGFGVLCSYRGLQPVLTAGDLLLTPGFLRAKFGINPKRVLIADSTVRAQLSSLNPEPDAPAILLATQPGLCPVAYGVTGARSLRTACSLGAILHMAGGILGIAIMVVLLLLNATHLLTPANVFLYQLVWVLPSLLITEWTRLV